MQQNKTKLSLTFENYCQWCVLTRRAWICRLCIFINWGCCWQIWHTWNIFIHQSTALSYHQLQ